MSPGIISDLLLLHVLAYLAGVGGRAVLVMLHGLGFYLLCRTPYVRNRGFRGHCWAAGKLGGTEFVKEHSQCFQTKVISNSCQWRSGALFAFGVILVTIAINFWYNGRFTLEAGLWMLFLHGMQPFFCQESLCVKAIEPDVCHCYSASAMLKFGKQNQKVIP